MYSIFTIAQDYAYSHFLFGQPKLYARPRGWVIFLTCSIDRPPYQAQLPLLAHTLTPSSYLLIVSAESNPPL